MQANRIRNVFDPNCGVDKGKAKIAYLVAGFPDFNRSLESAHALIEGGVNILELGLPYSDPIADGVVIQAAHTNALKQGFKMRDYLSFIQALRKLSPVPIVMFSYLNPILAHLKNNIIQELSKVGVDGILCVDISLEESQNLSLMCHSNQISLIPVIAPSTPKERINLIQKNVSGFLYYACRKGTTGVKTNLPPDLSTKLAEIKSLTDLPVVVGFGIADNQTAQAVLQMADGAVVGSFFVDALLKGANPSEIKLLAQRIFQGV